MVMSPDIASEHSEVVIVVDTPKDLSSAKLVVVEIRLHVGRCSYGRDRGMPC